jgi:PII-like signaling protein
LEIKNFPQSLNRSSQLLLIYLICNKSIYHNSFIKICGAWTAASVLRGIQGYGKRAQTTSTTRQ